MFDEIVKKLKSDSWFIINFFKQCQYFNNVDYINEYKISLDKEKKILSIDDFFRDKNKKKFLCQIYHTIWENISWESIINISNLTWTHLRRFWTWLEKLMINNSVNRCSERLAKTKKKAVVSLADEESGIIKLQMWRRNWT